MQQRAASSKRNENKFVCFVSRETVQKVTVCKNIS